MKNFLIKTEDTQEEVELTHFYILVKKFTLNPVSS